MKLQFFLSTFIVESSPVNNDTVIDTATSGSGFSSKTILITSENRHQCPEEDEMTFCEGEICIDWICPHGTTEHDSCELDFEDEAYERKKYRTCSCHKLIGSIQIFSGCKWKSVYFRPASLDIESTGEESNFITLQETIQVTEIQAAELPDNEIEENFMLFDIEAGIQITAKKPEKSSEISQIFVGSFGGCLNSLPRNADILCKLEETTRPCEIKCTDKTEHNVCLCDNEGCFWRNSFDKKCYSFEETDQQEESVRFAQQLVEKFREVKSDERHVKMIFREDGTYVHGFDLMLGLIEEMYDNGFLQKV
ncbi:unnamed protein product [Oikopleura dioica]|uniref:Uncharacterized protein n=1 Tax=Oikopleura dioica TaxID=34765 RepID=E4X1D3_OIKDI|nr:unnamed protein product [Oikopleura dioica]